MSALPSNTSASGAGQSIVEILLQVAEDALIAGDDAGARRNYETALRVDPANAIARMGLAELARESTPPGGFEAARSSFAPSIDRTKTLKLLKDPSELMAEPMPPTEAFVLSRVIPGTLTVGEIAKSCGAAPESLVFLVLASLMMRGVVAYA